MSKETKTYGGIAGDQLRQYIERIERLEEEKKAIMEDIKEVFAEAKGNGFDTKIMRKILSLRRMEASEREELQVLTDLYQMALGMIPAPDDQEEPTEEKGSAIRKDVRDAIATDNKRKSA